MKKIVLGLVIGLFGALCLAPTPVSAAPYCGITWGSLAKSSAATTTQSLTNIRTGQHDCYDRIVFDLTGTNATGYSVKYVSNVYGIASGKLIQLNNSGAKLQIVINAPASTTYSATENQPLPGVNLTGYQTFRDAKYASSFEGKTMIGLGVRAQLPFRVTTSGNHVIVDVAHAW